MAWTHAIVELQQADLEYQRNRQRLAELAKLLQASSAIAGMQQRLSQAQDKAKQARQNQETLEFELGKIQTKLRMDTEKLYSGRITNARELQDLQAETESLKRHITALEDKLLEAMMAREEADEAVVDASQELQRVTAEVEENQQHLTEEREALTARNQTLETHIADLHTQVPASILDTYEYLKNRTGNLPVAELHGDICGVCGIEVRRPVQQLARRQEEAYCGGCNRLLVVLEG
ncbi:MAG: hypothetical protein P1S60_02415 [Anaerolineae bacterium]|nr:hypothetical protein [Anaerolineae bacterium]